MILAANNGWSLTGASGGIVDGLLGLVLVAGLLWLYWNMG